MKKVWQPLPRGEVVKAIERGYPSRIPIFLGKWWGEGLEEQYGERLQAFDRFHEDIEGVWLEPLIHYDRMGLSWEIPQGGAYDARPVLDDWAKLDEFIEKLPDPQIDTRFEQLVAQAHKARTADRYIVAGWWRFFFVVFKQKFIILYSESCRNDKVLTVSSLMSIYLNGLKTDAANVFSFFGHQ